MRVAYVTPFDCGTGHAVRGIALVHAGRRAGIELRAFGPPKPVASEYEGTSDWQVRAHTYQPDLVLCDLRIGPFDAPIWLLLRYLAPHYRETQCERRIAIEPIAVEGVTHRVPPIVNTEATFRPADGQGLHAGYNTYWESVWFGYRDRVRWLRDGNPERQARIDAGGEMTKNGADALMALIRAEMLA